MIKVRAIGAAEIQIGRKRVTKSTEMMFALAVYLCVRAGARLTRDDVVDVFWPGRHVTKGRHSLRQMLYRLRLKGFTLDEDGDELRLDPARVECDATRALEDSWPETVEPWMIEESGEFLRGFTRDISPQFRDWLDAMRSRITRQYRLAAERQIELARGEGRWADMERWARVLLRSDPLNEKATTMWAESAVMVGSPAIGIEILDQFLEEIGECAGQSGQQAKQLRKRIAELTPEWGGETREVPIIGREALMSQLTEAIEAAAAGHGGAYLLKGAPGVGKTRISNEARAFAAFSGFRAIFLRVPVNASRQPLSVALRLIPQLLELRGAAGCSPLAMTVLRSATAPAITDAQHAQTPTTGDVLAWALTALLEAISEETKLLVQLDDLHHCDPESVALLGAVTPATRDLRVVWLATARYAGATAQSRAPSDAGFVTVGVPPLARDAALMLARAFSVPVVPSRAEADLLRIASISGGNPLFLREMCALRSVSLGSNNTPASLRKIIRERLAELTAFESRMLQIIGLNRPGFSGGSVS